MGNLPCGASKGALDRITLAAHPPLQQRRTNHQVVIDADSHLVVVIGRPFPGNRNDCKAWGNGKAELAAWKEAHNRSYKQVRARVGHVFARMKNWTILRDCRLKGEGVHHAIRGVARLHNLALAG
ncbi:hypothetical protein OK006_1407 [Actinobacteria bacterium OK006]|nr:hypothetical protein OK006_1407 [Actinobacteria bacterium OK006]